VSQFSGHTIKLRRKLTELVGPDDADTLISGLSSSSDVKDGSGLLASLGPVLGIAKVARGEMDRAEYIAQYGHRGPNEFELSVPRPAEDPGWLNEQLAQFRKSPVDVEALLSKQREEFTAAWNRFQASRPRKARSMRSRIGEVAPRARLREAVRSEYVRDRWVARTFALRAGQLTGLGDNIFFLTIDEVLDVLSGDETAVKFIPKRKETYRRYSALPAYPSIICGRFDPFQWAADPNLRNDIYDAYASTSGSTYDSSESKRDVVTGSAGSAGRIEGVVRRLDRPEDGDQFQKGEILVASQTSPGHHFSLARQQSSPMWERRSRTLPSLLASWAFPQLWAVATRPCACTLVIAFLSTAGKVSLWSYSGGNHIGP
jgi:pyruvate,water dikinase